MFNEILKDVPGIIDMQVGIMIFFLLIFIGTSVWAIRASKSYIEKMSRLPLEPLVSDSINGERHNG